MQGTGDGEDGWEIVGSVKSLGGREGREEGGKDTQIDLSTAVSSASH